jgi:hypothetical protein
MPTERILSVEDTIAALPVRKSRRWLVEFLHRTKTDPIGRPLYRLAGRDKLVYFDRLIEALPCPSSPGAPFKRRGKVPARAATAALASEWKRAAELTGDDSLADFSTKSHPRSRDDRKNPAN